MSTQLIAGPRQDVIDIGAIGLDFLWLEITPRCNLNCVHCYADSDMSRALHGNMKLEDWILLLHQARDLGCKKCQFIGGEPTLYPDLPVLITKARHLTFELIEIYTNGTHFTKLVKETFKENCVSLAFSIYSADPATHDRVTGHKGSFDRTMSSLRWAIGATLEVRVGFVEMGINKGEFERTRLLLRQEGVLNVRLDRIRGVGRGSEIVQGSSHMAELCGNCWRGSLCACANGLIYPCVFSRFYPVGTASEGLSSVVCGNQLARFRKELFATKPTAVGGTSSMQCDPTRLPPGCAPNCAPLCSPAARCNPIAQPCSPTLHPPECGPTVSPGPCIPIQPCMPNRA